MRKISIFILLFLVGSFVGCNNKADENFDEKKYQAELNNYANEYMSSLKGVLLKNMKEGGPLQAVQVCSDTAADLSVEFYKKNSVSVKRVSYLNRNPNNVPDEFESRALNQFSELLNNGQLDAKTSIIESSETENITTVRFVKPILVEAPCLNCHGSDNQISQDVSEVLKEKYPNDKATGYKIGDLRGVVSVTKIL